MTLLPQRRIGEVRRLFEHLISQRKQRMTLGEAIRFSRAMSKKTQAEFCEMIGVTQATISLWEKDLRVPDCNRLIQLAAWTKCEFVATKNGWKITHD